MSPDAGAWAAGLTGLHRGGDLGAEVRVTESRGRWQARVRPVVVATGATEEVRPRAGVMAGERRAG